MVLDPQIALNVEQLMNRIQHQVDAHPDSRSLLETIHDCRRYADGISECNRFSKDLASRTKFFFYKCLLRAFKGNFERQRLFNHSLINNLQVLADELDQIRRRLPTNDDEKTRSL